MARQLAKLSARAVAATKAVGRHSDGGGLYLVVDKGGAKRWVFLFRWRSKDWVGGPGKLREMGLGSLNAVTLARAREKAQCARAMVADRIDPICKERKDAPKPTFGQLADEFIALKRGELRSDKSVARIRRSLTVYCETIRSMPVDEVSVDEVLGILRPLWMTKPETGQNVRVYVEAVLDAAKARGIRTGDNPARWRAHLSHLLPHPKKLPRGHHRAVPFLELPELVRILREQRAMAARALEFLILTAGRSGEVLGARWSEIDFQAAVWTVPATRMKAGREHRVPLPRSAIALLQPLHTCALSDCVFPGAKPQAPLSGMAMEMMLRRLGLVGAHYGARLSKCVS